MGETVRSFGERTSGVRASPFKAEADVIRGLIRRSGELKKACKRTPLVVGVFMDQPIDEIINRTSAVDLDAVQLHGIESADFVKELRGKLPGVWVVKVVHLPPRGDAVAKADANLQELRARLIAYAALCDALLLDTSIKGAVAGGTG